jgi:hypothetical protein
MVWSRKPLTYKIWYTRAADCARLRLTSRKNDKVAKKAPNALTSLDAELKSAPTFRPGHLGRVLTSRSESLGLLALAQADGEVDAKSRAEIFLPITP